MYKLSSKSGKAHQRQKKGQIWAFMLVLLLASCKTIEYVPVESAKTDTLYIANKEVKYDSIYLERDRYIKGDTVYLAKVEYRYKYLNRTDTVYRERVEIKEIPVPVEVVKEKVVKKNIPLIYWLLVFFGGGICALLLLGRD